MKNYQKSNVNNRRPGPISGHAQRWVSNAAGSESKNAQRNYERYLALARAEAQNGNTVVTSTTAAEAPNIIYRQTERNSRF